MLFHLSKHLSRFTTFNKKIAYGMAKSKKDLYQLLGVNKNSNQNQIKKAYYKLAQELHPDKNPNPQAKDRFAEINNAYEILSDEKKRKNYDQTGSTDENPYEGFENQDIFNAFRQGFPGGGRRGHHNQVDPEDLQDLFEELLGGGGGGGKRNKKNRQNNFQQSQDVVVKVDLQFNQSVNGTSKNIQYKKKCTCGVCKGTKSKPGTKPQKCNTCQGTGYVTFQQSFMIMRSQCGNCNGTGQKISNPCTNCHGHGIETIKTHEQVKFPKGIDSGASLKFRGKGNLNGDLVINVNVKKHPLFKRQGIDSHIQKQISVLDAILGAQITVQTIYGQNKKVKVNPGTQSGDRIKLTKQGFFKLNSSQKGNQNITFRVKIPNKLTSQQKDLYQKIKKLSSK